MPIAVHSTIYYHVPNKSALYDLVMDAVLSGMSDAWYTEEATPRDRVLAGGRAYRDALLAHPRALPLVAGRPLRTEISLHPAELLLGTLAEAGLTYPRALAAVNGIAHYVTGAALAYAAHVTDAEYHEDLEEGELDALPEGRFPHIRAALAEGGFMQTEEEIDAGLEALVDGFFAQARQAGEQRKEGS